MMCKQVTETMTDESEGALSGLRRFLFRFHMRTCPYCRAHHKQYDATIATLNALPTEPPAPESRDRALAAFRKRNV